MYATSLYDNIEVINTVELPNNGQIRSRPFEDCLLQRIRRLSASQRLVYILVNSIHATWFVHYAAETVRS